MKPPKYFKTSEERWNEMLDKITDKPFYLWSNRDIIVFHCIYAIDEDRNVEKNLKNGIYSNYLASSRLSNKELRQDIASRKWSRDSELFKVTHRGMSRKEYEAWGEAMGMKYGLIFGFIGFIAIKLLELLN